MVNAVAARLRRSIKPGDVVMLSSPNRPEFIAAFLGVLAADAVVFPVHPGLTGSELREAAGRSSTKMLIACPSTFAALDDERLSFIDINSLTVEQPMNDAAHQSLERAAMLLQTSGTTGHPKIVVRSWRALDVVAVNVCHATNLTQHDRVLVAIPLGHSYGVENGLLAPVLAGATVHLMDGFDPSIAAEQLFGGLTGITVFPGVPFMWQALAERIPALSAPSARGLRLAYSAGGPLPQSVFEGCEANLNIRLGQLYGSTEIGSVTFNDPNSPQHDPTSAGLAMEGVSISVLDPETLDIDQPLEVGEQGHVAIRSPSMLDRYIDDATPAHHHGYFLTGDLGRLDAGGCLTITGRVKLQIDVGGFKVNPLEVESVLSQHPAVRECVVIALPMTQTVDRLKALVILEDKSTSVSNEVLRQFMRERLAAHKVPRVIEVRDKLPRSAIGKVMRERLLCE